MILTEKWKAQSQRVKFSKLVVILISKIKVERLQITSGF